MTRIQWVLAVLIIGGIGGVAMERWILPYFGIFNPQAPVVITKREEIRINEGINQTEIAGRLKPALVTVYFHEGEFGSPRFRLTASSPGIIVTSDGIAVIPARTARAGGMITVLTAENRIFKGSLAASDALASVSFVRLEGARDLPVVRQGFAREIAPGERLLGISRTEDGEVLAKPVTANRKGVASASISTVYQFERLNSTLQFGGEFGPSDLGGVVVNREGLAVGFITQTGKEVLVIRVEDLQLVLDNFLDDGKIIWPSFKSSYLILGASQTKLLDLSKNYGVLIKSAPGLADGDFVFEADGKTLSAEESFQAILLAKRPGERVKLKLLRDGFERELEINL